MTGVAPTETLSYRIGAAHDMLQHILHDPSNEINGILWGALSGVEIILREARERANELLSNAEKPKAVNA